MLDVVRNEYTLSWLPAESAPLTVNAAVPNGAPASGKANAAAASVSVAAAMGSHATSQYCWKSLDSWTQLKFWPGGSSLPPGSGALDLQNGLGGAPSGLNSTWSQPPCRASLPATSALPPSLRYSRMLSVSS